MLRLPTSTSPSNVLVCAGQGVLADPNGPFSWSPPWPRDGRLGCCLSDRTTAKAVDRGWSRSGHPCGRKPVGNLCDTLSIAPLAAPFGCNLFAKRRLQPPEPPRQAEGPLDGPLHTQAPDRSRPNLALANRIDCGVKVLVWPVVSAVPAQRRGTSNTLHTLTSDDVRTPLPQWERIRPRNKRSRKAHSCSPSKVCAYTYCPMKRDDDKAAASR
ncbi:hypothetical protein B0T19DRAFT_58797 [Cercophora scortea]|uniref:Uncharacterized protein n=1 Tax=Cercophora scortea TaxID=314031 RepID=A0AAE0J6B9_9PEZI|nr:hypothetical protein B0T19DRAFT_58797 [Cercophora scortea]